MLRTESEADPFIDVVRKFGDDNDSPNGDIFDDTSSVARTNKLQKIRNILLEMFNNCKAPLATYLLMTMHLIRIVPYCSFQLFP